MNIYFVLVPKLQFITDKVFSAHIETCHWHSRNLWTKYFREQNIFRIKIFFVWVDSIGVLQDKLAFSLNLLGGTTESSAPIFPFQGSMLDFGDELLLDEDKM